MKLLLYLLFSIKPAYFESIYLIEKTPLDSAVKYTYNTQKNSPDSTILDYTITLASRKVSSYTFNEFMKKMPEIQRALPYIDSLFSLYEHNFTMYDSLLYNYLRLSLFTLPKQKINQRLIHLFKKYRGNSSILNVIAFYASRYNARETLSYILPYMDKNIGKLNSKLLLVLAQDYLERNDLKRLNNILVELSRRELSHEENMDLYKIKGLYFEKIDNIDSALSYLTLYTTMSSELDMNISRHLVSLYIKKGLFGDAKKTLLSLLTVSPFDAELRKQAGYIYFMTQQYDSSLLEYLIAKSLLQNDPQIHYYISRVLVRKGLYKDALSSVDKAIKIENRYAYNLLKAFILLKLGYIDDAARLLLVLKKRGSFDPYYYYLTGLVLKSMGRKKLSYKYFLKSISLDSTKPLRYLPTLSLASDLKDTSFLKTALEKVRTLKLSDKDDLFDVAYAAQILNDTLLADSLYRLLLTKDPQNALYLNNIGYMWLENGNIEKAQKYIEKAYKLNPEDPYIMDSYAWLLFKLGKIEEAYRISKKAVKQAGKDREIKRHYYIIKKAYAKKKQ